MRFSSALALLYLALFPHASLLAQDKAPVSVPFVGCKSDGQVGPKEAPAGTRVAVPVTPEAAQELAYYTAQGIGVLAPRGWYCFGTYGSGGESLSVIPKSIDTASILSTVSGGWASSAIEVSHRLGGGSGLFDVAEIIARVFPAYKSFVIKVEELDPSERSFTFGPYPKDVLNYRSTKVVEYKTPAHTDGLGTHSWLKKNGSPIEGVAMLVGDTPDLLLLSVRLPSELNELTSIIVRQVERDAERSDRQ